MLAKIGAGISVSVGAGVDVAVFAARVAVEFATAVAFPAFVGASATMVVVTVLLDASVIGVTWLIGSTVAVLVGRAVRVACGVSVGSGGGSGAPHAASKSTRIETNKMNVGLDCISYTQLKICAASISQGGDVSNSLTRARFSSSMTNRSQSSEASNQKRIFWRLTTVY